MIDTSRPTRRDLLRTLAAGRVAAASASLLGGCAAGSTVQNVTPAPLPPAAPAGNLIMIIRHGEKPPNSGPPQGIDPDGNPDPHSLTVRGWRVGGRAEQRRRRDVRETRGLR
jgi:hypothetical protein